MKVTHLVLGFLLTLAGGAVYADTTPKDQEKILSELSTINQKEIKAGQLAEAKATLPDVINYGKSIVADHQKLQEEVTQYAKDNNLTLKPSDESVANLETVSGAEFDQKFIDSMVKDHDKAITKIKKARDKATDVKLKAFLSAALISLEKHHASAQKIERKLTQGA